MERRRPSHKHKHKHKHKKHNKHDLSLSLSLLRCGPHPPLLIHLFTSLLSLLCFSIYIYLSLSLCPSTFYIWPYNIIYLFIALDLLCLSPQLVDLLPFLNSSIIMDTHQHTAARLIRSEGKRGLSDEESEEEEYSSEALALGGYGGGEEYGGRRKRVMTDLYSNSSSSKRGGSKAGGGSSGAAAAMPPSCQVDGCDSDLSEAKQYHRRHKVCEYHAKAPSVHISGFQQRFCQQCSRFHELSEFDDSKRSCRRRLAGHNERRRKNATD